MGFPCVFAFSQLRYVALAKYDGDDNEGKGKKKPCQEEGKGKDIYTRIHSEDGKVCIRARGIANWGCSCIIYTLFTRSDQSVV
jgi:hypothetical protein